MPHRDGMHIDEEDLPGVGIRNDFLTANGRRVGVITRRNGTRDLLIYKKGDPDSVSETVSLTEGEADVLAEYLGTRRVIHRLSHITDQIDGLESGKVSIPHDSPLVGMELGDADIRRKTGASVVAIWRNKMVEASPLADFVLHAGDVLVVIGSDEAIEAVRDLVDGV